MTVHAEFRARPGTTGEAAGSQVTPVELAEILTSHTILHRDTTYHMSLNPNQTAYHTNLPHGALISVLLLLTAAHLVCFSTHLVLYCLKYWHPLFQRKSLLSSFMLKI